MPYQAIVRAYLMYQRGKFVASCKGRFGIVQNMIALTDQRFGYRPALVQVVGALILAGYEIKDAPMNSEYYLKAYDSNEEVNS